jgi:hypothetical protein
MRQWPQVVSRCSCYLLEFSDAPTKTHQLNKWTTARRNGQHAHPWLLWTKGLDLLGKHISRMGTGLGNFFWSLGFSSAVSSPAGWIVQLGNVEVKNHHWKIISTVLLVLCCRGAVLMMLIHVYWSPLRFWSSWLPEVILATCLSYENFLWCWSEIWCRWSLMFLLLVRQSLRWWCCCISCSCHWGYLLLLLESKNLPLRCYFSELVFQCVVRWYSGA